MFFSFQSRHLTSNDWHQQNEWPDSGVGWAGTGLQLWQYFLVTLFLLPETFQREIKFNNRIFCRKALGSIRSLLIKPVTYLSFILLMDLSLNTAQRSRYRGTPALRVSELDQTLGRTTWTSKLRQWHIFFCIILFNLTALPRVRTVTGWPAVGRVLGQRDIWKSNSYPK